MFSWLRKIFMTNNTEIKPNIDNNTISNQIIKPNIEREFEIAVYDISINESTGREEMKPVLFEKPLIITAKTPQELKTKLDLYKNTGQLAKVVREVNQKKIITNTPQSIISQPINTTNTKQTILNTEQQQILKNKPRFFKVGDIEVKDDNGKIYQKQWVQLTDTEATNIRIINDKNNSVVNLTGKHIEMKKWILVENINNESINLEENF